METTQKQIIANALATLTENISQNRLAKKAGVSSATISQMINGKHALISDEMWLKVQVSLKIDTDWQIVATKNYGILTSYLKLAKRQFMNLAFSHHEGSGKSQAFSDFEKTTPNVIYLECATYWSRKNLVRALITQAGLDEEGNITYLVDRLVDHLQGLKNPVVIIDQADKLSDTSLDLLIDFHNRMNGQCSFIMSGVQALQIRVEKGYKKNKTGYRELYSRFGRKFIQLEKLSKLDCKKICEANGVDDKDTIEHIYNTMDDDLRILKKEVNKYLLKKAQAA